MNDFSAEQKLRLINSALAVRENAYAPYSNYLVGAALLGTNGEVYTGCNVENASYPASICAERSALVQAVSAGQREFKGIAVATADGGSPCGICRQMLYEFAPTMPIIIVNQNGEVLLEQRLDDLLPHGFGPSNLLK